MSSYSFFRIPYEGNLQTIQEHINNLFSDVQMKIPQKGTLLVKIPVDIEEEFLFTKNMIIDEKTGTKLGNFEFVREFEFDDAIDTELNNINNEKNENPNKKNKNLEYKRQISDILLNEETTEEENKKSGYNFWSKLNITKIGLGGFGENLEKEYKDPYDFFFSKEYLIICFILSVICLVLFNF